MGHRKRQDLLNRLGAWEPQERIKGEGKKGREAEKNVELNTINKKTTDENNNKKS